MTRPAPHFVWLIGLAVVMCFAAHGGATAAAGTSGTPTIPSAPGAKLIRELRLSGPLLERLKEHRPGLAGIQDVVIRRYSNRHKGSETDLGAAMAHYQSEMEQLGWDLLISDLTGSRRDAAYASPDGSLLFAVSVDPRGSITSIVKGQIALEQIPDLERAILRTLAPSCPPPAPEDQAVLTQADKLIEDGKAPEAVALLRREIDKRPRSVLLREKMAELHLKANRKDERLNELESIVALEPDSYPARLKYARELYEQKADLKRALFEFSQAAAMSPDQATPRYFIGRVYQDMGQMDKALEQYAEAERIAPHWVSTSLRIASIHEKRGEMSLAAQAYRRALAVKPGLEPAREGLERVEKAAADR